MSITINGYDFPIKTIMTRIIPSSLVETVVVTGVGECVSSEYELGGEINVKIMGWSLSFPDLDAIIQNVNYNDLVELNSTDFGAETMLVTDYECREHLDGTVTFTFNGRIGAPTLVIIDTYLTESL